MDITPDIKYFITGVQDDSIKIWSTKDFCLSFLVKNSYTEGIQPLRIAALIVNQAINFNTLKF